MPRVVLTPVPFSLALPPPPPPQQTRKPASSATARDSIHQNATTLLSQPSCPTPAPSPPRPPSVDPSTAQLLVLASRIAALHRRCAERLALARRELPLAVPLKRTRSFPTPQTRSAASPPSSTPSSIACPPCSPSSSTGSASRSDLSVELVCLTCDEDGSEGEED